MRLSREEFWVLDTTTTLNSQLRLSILNASNADLIFNKRRHHGLSTNKLIDLILFMQQQGDLAVYRDEKGMFPEFEAEMNRLPRAPEIRTVIDFTPIWENPVFYSRVDIAADFHDNEEYVSRNQGREFSDRKPRPKGILHYCATKQGAAKWEETAQVDWNKYLDTWDSLIDDADLAEDQWLSLGRAAAVSKETLDVYFDWLIRWEAHPDSDECFCFKRYATERIRPWRATYWKTFPEGFECDFKELSIHRTEGMNKAESERYSIFFKNSWKEHHALFDWHNHYVRDFPFEGD